MIKLRSLFIVSLIVLFTGFKTNNLPAFFSDRLARAQLTFVTPDHYKEVPIIKNTQMHYEFAIKHPDKDFEVRYAVVPLDSVFIQFNAMRNDKNSVNVNLVGPNKLYEAAFLATMYNINGGSKPPQINPFPEKAVKHDFNADWGATGICEVGGDFGKGYKYCVGVAIHKDNLADAYCFFLSNNTEDFESLMSPIFYNLKFK